MMVRFLTIFLSAFWLAYAASSVLAEQGSQYVALGSSFAAGPGIGERDLASPGPCRRSSKDYAHLYAKAHGISLDDRTCSGATTKDVIAGGQFGLGAQIEAVTATTKLVTVTIGGNDVFYIRNLYAQACARDPADVPDFLRSGPYCKKVPDADVAKAFGLLAQQLRQVAISVKTRAPGARLVFVNYFTIAPPNGTCAAFKLSSEEAAGARGVAGQLANITRTVAKEVGASLLDAAKLSEDHNICATNSWIQPFAFPSTQNGFGPFAFHPTEEAMRAVANHLNDQ